MPVCSGAAASAHSVGACAAGPAGGGRPGRHPGHNLSAGRKILTTSQDNRLRVWDYLYSTNQARSCRGMEQTAG